MQEMIPERGDMEVSIPVTFDIQGHRDNLSIRKMVLGLFFIFLALVAMILLFIFATDEFKPQLPLIVFFGTFYFIRIFFIKEWKYKKKQRELRERDYKFNTKVFWGIYSINEYYPFVCNMANGNKAIFVAFDKDVIIGRDETADYDHYEAIANAYSIMFKKGIWCVHVDYADTVGKDNRLDSLFKNLTETENKDLRNETVRLYDYVQTYMYRSYADYDVYAFYYNGREEAFWDDLQPVIDALSEANYVRNRILSREEIGELCMTLMNLNEFSTTRATESVFLANTRGGNNIKVIWTEKDGVRKIVNRTREEIENERRVKAAESELRSKRLKKENKRKKKNKKGNTDNDIDMNQNLNIFDDEDDIFIETGDTKTVEVSESKTENTDDKKSVSIKKPSIDMNANLDIFDD